MKTWNIADKQDHFHDAGSSCPQFILTVWKRVTRTCNKTSPFVFQVRLSKLLLFVCLFVSAECVHQCLTHEKLLKSFKVSPSEHILIKLTDLFWKNIQHARFFQFLPWLENSRPTPKRTMQPFWCSDAFCGVCQQNMLYCYHYSQNKRQHNMKLKANIIFSLREMCNLLFHSTSCSLYCRLYQTYMLLHFPHPRDVSFRTWQLYEKILKATGTFSSWKTLRNWATLCISKHKHILINAALTQKRGR